MNRLMKGLVLILGFQGALALGGEIESGKTHFFGMAICPPWKTHGQDVCQRTLDHLQTSLIPKLGVSKEDVTLLSGGEATYRGLYKSLAEFSNNVNQEDRVIFYINVHNMVLDNYKVFNPLPSGTPRQDVMVLWTEEMPFTTLSAVKYKQWILASEFRRIIDQIPGQQKIFIIDACESEEIADELISEIPGSQSPRNKTVAIVSSKYDQFANFNREQTLPLFTEQLLHHINEGAPNLLEAFERARISSYEIAKNEICPKLAMQYKTVEEKSCAQKAILKDAGGLAGQIRL